MNNGGCSSVATCHNVPDSYYCTCQTGYTGDGHTCTGKRIDRYSFRVHHSNTSISGCIYMLLAGYVLHAVYATTICLYIFYNSLLPTWLTINSKPLCHTNEDKLLTCLQNLAAELCPYGTVYQQQQFVLRTVCIFKRKLRSHS